MSSEELYTVNVQNQGERYLSCIAEAMDCSDAGEMTRHVQEAIPVGQSLMDDLEELLDSTEDADISEKIAQAMHQIGLAVDQTYDSLESSQEELPELINQIHRHAERALDYIYQI
jgi:ABC-type transporter Mla subunit MlaD